MNGGATRTAEGSALTQPSELLTGRGSWLFPPRVLALTEGARPTPGSEPALVTPHGPTASARAPERGLGAGGRDPGRRDGRGLHAHGRRRSLFLEPQVGDQLRQPVG